MSSEYNYDNDSSFFPYFVLTISSLVVLPLTYTLLRAPSDASESNKGHQITSTYSPDNADIIDAQRAKQKRKELRTKRMITAVGGWLLIGYMAYLMAVVKRTTETVWDPWSVLDLSMSASEKQINSKYRILSKTMHPDKRRPNPALNETLESVNNDYMDIVKAFKTLTDEDIRNNWQQFGHPDGRQSTSFGIALPQFLVAEGSGKYVLIFYGALLGVGLPWLVGKWWYGMQQRTKEKVYVTSAGNMFREYTERMDSGDVAAAVSSSNEFKDILDGAQADTGLGKLEGKLKAADDLAIGMLAKDRKKLDEIEDPVRRKTLALIWAYLARVNLDDKTLEAEKYELAPTTLRLNEAFMSIALAYGFTAPVLSAFHLSQDLVQAIPPSSARLPLLQLPHFTPNVVKSIEQSTGKKEHLSIQSFMALPSEQRRALASAAGLSSNNLSTAETVALQLPLLKVEKAFFKVQGEKYIIPSSLVQFVLKARFIPPGSKNVPSINEKDLLEPDPADGDLAAQKQEPEQHTIPLAYAPYLPRDRAPRWHVFLADNRQAKIAVPPFTFQHFDKKAFDDEGKPTFEVVTLKMQFQAPPQAGEYKFQMHVVCDSYVGFDYKEEAVMKVEEASKAFDGADEEDDISEPEEGESRYSTFQVGAVLLDAN